MLFTNASIGGTTGGNMTLKIKSDAILRGVSIQPESGSTVDNIAVRLLLRSLERVGGSLLLRQGYTKTLNSTVIPLSWHGEQRIPADFEYEIFATIWSRGGATLKFSLVAYMEDDED